MRTKKVLKLTTIITCLALASCEKEEKDDSANSAIISNNDCSTVITNTDGPKAGDTYISLMANYDNTVIDSLIGISGSDKTWDFSNLTESGLDNDTIIFKSETNIPSDIDANLVLIGNSDLFLKSHPAGLDITALEYNAEEEVNIGFNFDVDVDVVNPLTILPYTLKINKVLIDDFKIQGYISDTLDTLDLGGFLGEQYNIPFELNIDISNSNEFSFDGCGIIITPKGEFNCLRFIVETGQTESEVNATALVEGTNTNIPQSLIEEYLDIDELTDDINFNFYEGTTYVWISKDHGYPLAQVKIDDNGNIEHVEYLK